MARSNIGVRTTSVTHEGAPARRISPYQELRRSVLACLLWEDTFYESGVSIALRIRDLSKQVSAEELGALALECRTQYRMRHAPLLLLRELLRHPGGKGVYVSDTISATIQRADEMGELLALYWASNNGKRTLPKQLKRGLALAFNKFSAYQLAKYDRASDKVRLRDVLFLCHAKPTSPEQATVWKQLVDGTLPSPDTWEVGLSTGGDKRETFTRLLVERKLGYMALLRNLRNMEQAGVDMSLVADSLRAGAATSKALPFRFLTAARACPQLEPVLDECMQACLAELPRLTGPTRVLVDVSGSMDYDKISKRSELTRRQGAAALAALVRGVSDECRVFTFADNVQEVPPRHGMALVDAICGTPSGGTRLGHAVRSVDDGSRLIVVTDEQSHDVVSNPKGRGYMINVASYQNGVASYQNSISYGPWTHITGWSEQVVRYIQELEQS